MTSSTPKRRLNITGTSTQSAPAANEPVEYLGRSGLHAKSPTSVAGKDNDAREVEPVASEAHSRLSQAESREISCVGHRFLRSFIAGAVRIGEETGPRQIAGEKIVDRPTDLGFALGVGEPRHFAMRS